MIIVYLTVTKDMFNLGITLGSHSTLKLGPKSTHLCLKTEGVPTSPSHMADFKNLKKKLSEVETSASIDI